MKIMLYKLLNIYFLLLVFSNISAQSWSVIPYNEITDESLSIFSLFEDSEGNIWGGNGSSGRIIHWDGTDWETFNNSETGLTNNSPYVGDIYQDSSGKIWFGSGDGVATWENGNWFNYKSSNSDLPENRVNGIVEEEGKIWLATRKNLVSFDGTTWNTIEIEDAGWSSNSLASMGNGSFFVTMGDGSSIRRFDGTDWETISMANSNVNSDYQYHVEKIDNETFWFGGPSGRSNLYENGQWTPSEDITGWSLGLNESITKIAANSSKDDVWFATTDGLFHLKDGIGVEYRSDNSPMTSNDIKTVMVTNDGIMWCATANELVTFDPNGTTSISEIPTDISLDILTNPAKEILNLSINFNSANLKANGLITIFTTSGQPVAVKEVNDFQMKIEIGDLTTGNYILQYSDGINKIHTQFLKL